MFVRFPSWHLLRGIGASYFSTWTMIVPFLGYLILLGSISGSTYSIDLSSIGVGDTATDTNGSFLRLKITYIGLSIIGYATILFRIACPSEISNSKDMDEYILAAPTISFPDDAKRKLERIQKKFWYERYIEGCGEARAVALHEENRTRAALLHSDGEAPSLDRDDWLNKNINSLNAISYLCYEIANYSKIPVRYLIFLMYFVGFIATLVPSVQIFIGVLRNIIFYQ